MTWGVMIGILIIFVVEVGSGIPIANVSNEDIPKLAALGAITPDTIDHGTKTAGFFVLVGADMPAVLYETAFISNPDDEARLGTADYRQKLADAIVNAVRAYRDGL